MISSPKSNHCPLSTGYHSFSYDSDHFQKIESPSTSSSSTSASIAKEHHLSSSRSPQIEQSHPADSLDPAFIECLLAATNQSGITTAPLVDKSSFSSSLLQLPPSSAQLAPKSAPFSSLTTPCWTSTTPDSGACFPTIPLTGTEQWTCSTLGLTTVPFNPFGLYTPTTGQMPASADHSGTFDPMTSVPLPQGPCWPPTYMPSANHQPLAPSYLGPSDYYIDPSATYDSSTQPSSPEHVYSSNNTSTCATAQTSPQSAHFQALLGSGSEHASYPLLVPQNRKRSATINTTSSTAPSTSPNTPPIPAYTTHENPYPLMNHRPSVARQPSAPALSMPSSSTLFSLSPNPMDTYTTGGSNHGKRVIHPSPRHSRAPGYKESLNLGAGGGGMLFHPSQTYSYFGDGFGFGGGDSKPARFKPSKEQLDILVKSYNENKNPDAHTREALARQLGPDVKPKTLQIWFQNRRSKSRAKEREANLPKRLDVRDRSTPPTRNVSATATKRCVNSEALKALAHDDDPNLLLIPITVLSIANWTRFLTPGSGYTLPDLGCSVSLNIHEPVLDLYVVHQSETYKVVIPIHSNAMANIQGTSNPVLNTDAVAMNFELAPGSARFMGWQATSDGIRQSWQPVGDFTSGEASHGGRVEITGDKTGLLNAFTRIHGLLESLPTPLASAQSLNAVNAVHLGGLATGWILPNTASTFSMPRSAVGSQNPPSSDSGMEFTSLNPSHSAQYPSGTSGPHVRHHLRSLSASTTNGFKHPLMLSHAPGHHATQSLSVGYGPMTRLAGNGSNDYATSSLPWTATNGDHPVLPPLLGDSDSWPGARQSTPNSAPPPAVHGSPASAVQAETKVNGSHLTHNRHLSGQSNASTYYGSIGSLGFSNLQQSDAAEDPTHDESPRRLNDGVPVSKGQETPQEELSEEYRRPIHNSEHRAPQPKSFTASPEALDLFSEGVEKGQSREGSATSSVSVYSTQEVGL